MAKAGLDRRRTGTLRLLSDSPDSCNSSLGSLSVLQTIGLCVEVSWTCFGGVLQWQRAVLNLPHPICKASGFPSKHCRLETSQTQDWYKMVQNLWVTHTCAQVSGSLLQRVGKPWLLMDTGQRSTLHVCFEAAPKVNWHKYKLLKLGFATEMWS